MHSILLIIITIYITLTARVLDGSSSQMLVKACSLKLNDVKVGHGFIAGSRKVKGL